MILKSVLVVSCLAATPVVLVSSAQDSRSQGSQPTSQSTKERTKESTNEASNDAGELRSEVTRLREALQRERERADEALRELREALDMLLREDRHERNCTPSRDLLTQHEWLHERGHDDHAAVAFERLVEQYDDDHSRLNRLAWHLMSDDETCGHFDATALKLAQRIEGDPEDMSHRVLDTLALAYFLNGHLERAVPLQQAAVEKHGSDEYRRRLRTYEAAVAALPRVDEQPPLDAVGGGE